MSIITKEFMQLMAIQGLIQSPGYFIKSYTGIRHLRRIKIHALASENAPSPIKPKAFKKERTPG